jgi:quinol-cytochrome oxidoreductase complex cytochrome b subunit
MLLLLFLPFLDRSGREVLWKRPIAMTVTSVCVVAIVGLTILGASAPKLETQDTDPPAGEVQQIAPPETETDEVEEEEDVFDFQLTEEDLE